MQRGATQVFRIVRWALWAGWLLAALTAMVLALSPARALLGLSPGVVFGPATITGLPWTLPVYLTPLDSVTTLALLMVANLLNVAVGFILARGED